MKIIVLIGGNSAERNVSIASGKAIAKGLRENGHDVKVIDPVYGKDQPEEHEIYETHNEIGKEFPAAEELNNYSNIKVLECISSSLFDDADIVFLGLHGKFGEDGRIQSLLEYRNVHYTGSDVLSSSIAMDKNISKILFNHLNIPTPKWFTLDKGNNNLKDINERITENFGYPCVIKPNDEGSTVGLTVIENEKALSQAIELAFRYSNRIIAEDFIEGRELTVAVLGDEALPVLEIKPKGGIYDYEHKYTKGMSEYVCPAEISKDLSDKLKQTSLYAHNSLRCKAYSRVDYRIDSNENYLCLEVNTLPGMTETSLVPKAAAATGLNFNSLLNKIIELSLK